jgi:hypothetical protein
MKIRITPTLITAYTTLATLTVGILAYSALSAAHKDRSQKTTAFESVAKPEPARIASLAIKDKRRRILQ